MQHCKHQLQLLHGKGYVFYIPMAEQTVTLVIFVPAFGFHFRVPAGHCTEIPFIATVANFFCDIVDLLLG